MGSITEQLISLRGQGLLTDLDLHFARLMCRLAGEESPELAFGAALASNWTSNGHVCLDLAAEAGRKLCAESAAPELTDWQAGLRKSSVVGRPGEYRPLILDEAGRLYLYRYWEYEQEVAEALKRRAGEEMAAVDEALLRDGLGQLFPQRGGGRTDWQKLAAATALLRRFTVISGGPGTGKTSTVVRILALLRQQPGGEDLNIALAAPTGKAAARMQEAIHAAKQALPLDEKVRDSIPDKASTLHRLLGGSPISVYFRHNRENPLAVDVLILDEASMVDIALMAKLIRALPARACLIMLGDKDQLASVEAGAVLGDICNEVPGFSDTFSKRLLSLTGEHVPACPSKAPVMADAIVLLRHSYRFGHESGIGRLAAAVNQGQGQECLTLLTDKTLPDIAPVSSAMPLAHQAAELYREYLERIHAGAPAAEVFLAFNRFRVLCAVRGGPDGVSVLNREIEARLDASGLIDAREPYYAGRPLMITHNDHDLRLYNGDVGMVLPDPDEEGRLRVCFQTAEGLMRQLSPARLPGHETVYAMTVHKSQGSEFDRVMLILPEAGSQALSRELLYTGVTRACRRLEISASERALTTAIGRRLYRASGLGDALWKSAGSRV